MSNKSRRFLWFTGVLFLMIFLPHNLPAGNLKILQNKTFNVNAAGNFILDTEGGDIKVRTWDKNQINVKILGNSRAEKRFTFSFEHIKNYLKVTAKKKKPFLFDWFSSIDIKYEITLPGKFSVELQTAGGNIDLYNIDGKIRAATSGGDIRIADAAGSADLKTAGGDIRVINFEGNLLVKTAGGDINLANVNGKIEANTSGGDISLDFSGVNKGIELYTSGGDIGISVPSNFSADIDLQTLAGEITVNLKDLRNIKTSLYSFNAQKGAAMYPLTAKTSGGDITLESKK